MTLKIAIEVDEKDITNLLHGHRGSYSPWLHRLSGRWYSRRGMLVHYDAATDEEGSNKGRGRFGRRAVMRGLAIMAKKAPNAFANFMKGNDDDLAFDCALQCIVFGKLVYA